MTTLPLELIVEHVPLYLRRSDWNRLSVANRECRQRLESKDNAPWPNDDFVLDVHHDTNNVNHEVNHQPVEGIEVNCMAVSPHNDGEWIACACNDGSIRLWDRRSGRRKVIERGNVEDEEITQLLFHPTNPNTLIALEYFGRIFLFDDIRRQPEPAARILPWHHEFDSPTSDLAVSSDGERLATAATHIDTGTKCILIYSLNGDCSLLRYWRVDDDDGDDVEALVFDPLSSNGRYLASIQWMDDKITLWDLETSDRGESTNNTDGDCPTHTVFRGKPNVAIWSTTIGRSSGEEDKWSLLAGLCVDGSILVWELASNNSRNVSNLASKSLEACNDESEVDAVAISPIKSHGKLIAAGYDDGRIELWKIRNNAPSRVATMSCPEDHFRVSANYGSSKYSNLFFTPDGRTIIAADSTGHIYFRRVPL